MATLEKFDEVNMMCARENPIHDQISNFSIALYVLDYFKAPDLLSIDDIDMNAAAEILKENFEKIEKTDIPIEYSIAESKDRFLLVIGDLNFPTHFAAVVDMKSKQPFFSKLNFMGSGYDSFEDLEHEFFWNDEIYREDVYFLKKCHTE